MSERSESTGITAIKTRLAELEDRVDEVEAANEELRERVDEVEAANEDLQEENERLQEENEDLRERVDDLEARIGYNLTDIAELESAVEDLQTGTHASNPSSETGESAAHPSYEPETPLEQIVGLPESMVQEQLTANQDRARFIARDIREYGRKTGTKSTGFNYAIDSGTLKKVLKASYDVSHTETVNRVIEWLDELGKDETLVRTKNGRRKIIFRGDLVRRIETAKQCSENHGTVIAEQEA